MGCPAPRRGLPEHFGRLAKHVGGNVVMLRTNTYNILTSSIGMDTVLTSATIWLPGRESPLCLHGCGDMEDHCRATVVVIVEAERDGYGSGGHFRGAVFHHSLQGAPFCTKGHRYR